MNADPGSGGGAPFVGRASELAELLAGLDSAMSGSGRLFLIGGEPGIGKSRLADELATRARSRGADVLVGRCWEAGGAPPFWPWVQAIRARVRTRDPDLLRRELGVGAGDVAHIVPELRVAFPDLPALPALESEAARFRLFDAVTSFLRRTAQAQPLVLVLDDLHAADEPSLLLLEFVTQELATSRVLVLAAYRDADPALADPLAAALVELSRELITKRISLTGLDEEQVGRFIELNAAEKPAQDLVRLVRDHTDGNPLFVGEIVRLLEAEGGVDQAAPRLRVPETLRDAVSRRLGHLSETCNSVLAVASVLGREFDLDLLARVCELERTAIVDALGEAGAERVVTEVPSGAGRLRFSHVVIRDMLYEELSPSRRRELHRRVKEALEALSARDLGPHLAELAHHAVAAGDRVNGLRYAREAGDRALELLAFEEAARLYGSAIELADDDVDRCELLLSLGNAEMRAGNNAAAKRSFTWAADIARELGRSRELARAALGYAGRKVWARPGRDTDLVPLLEEGLAALGDADDELRARLLARLSGALRDEPSPERRDRISQEAITLARRAGSDEALLYALDARAGAIISPETASECLGLGREILEVAGRVGNRERLVAAYEVRLVSHLILGDMSAAASDLDAAAAVAEELRQPALLWDVGGDRAMLALTDGRLDEAEELIERALALGERAAPELAIPVYHVQRYTLADFRGGLEEIEPSLSQLVAEHSTRPVLRCALAHVQARLGRLDEARDTLVELAADDFSALPFDQEWLYAMSLLAEVCWLVDAGAYAAPLYNLLAPWAHLNSADLAEGARGSVSRYLGLLAETLQRLDEAERHLENALEMNVRMRARPWEAYTERDYARLLLARGLEGDRQRAVELLRSALATAGELGMEPLAAEVSALLEGTDGAAEAFAGYRLDEEVGRGGMGVVYRATELALDRPVALKLIAPELAGDASFREGFLRESRLAASIDHPGILPVYAAGDADGELYLASRYVDGTDLRSLLRREGPLPPERALGLVEQVAEALDAAHGRGLVHRDVKPGNVLVDSGGHCYLCDFGLTKQLTDGATTAAGQLVGSLDYLAPEQIRREPVNGRADQYALACVLYECLTGAPPFRRETEAQTLWGHMQEPPAPLPEYPELDPVLMRGLAKEPQERFESCGQLLESAREALGLGPSRSVVLRRRRRVGGRLLIAGAALIAAAVAVAALIATLGSEGAITAPPNSVAAIDATSQEVVAAIPVGDAPTSVAASDDWAWVINSNDGAGTISRIDPREKRVVKTFSVPGRPSDLLAAAGSLWVGTNDGRVFQFEPESDIELASFRLPNAGRTSSFVVDRGAGYLASGDDAVWAASFRAFSRIDPASETLTHGPSSVWGPFAYGFGSLWTTGAHVGLFRLAPATLRRQATVELPISSQDVAVGLGSVWLPDDEGNKVWQIDPKRDVVQATYETGGRSRAAAVGQGAVWATSDDGSIVRIAPTTGEVDHIAVGGAPTGIAVGGGLVWTSVQ